MAWGDAGEQNRLINRALKAIDLVLRYCTVLYTSHLCVWWLNLDVIIINENHHDLNLWAKLLG